MFKVRNAFTYNFGAGANNLTVDVKAGARCHWHAENSCYYVSPSEVETYARHDATYRGIRVDPANVESE